MKNPFKDRYFLKIKINKNNNDSFVVFRFSRTTVLISDGNDGISWLC